MGRKVSIKKAALINAAGKYSKVILALVVNAILARILQPEDFGVIAVVTVFTTLFTSIADMGFGTAVVQRKDLQNSQINDIFSFTCYMSAVLAILFFICGWPIASFFNDSLYVPLCHLLSVSLFFSALNMVPNGIMNREKRFKSLALRTVCVYGFSSVVAIGLALGGASYYSLAWQSVISSFATFVWNFTSTKPCFKFQFEMQSVRSVFGYSGFQFAFNLVTYLSDNMDNFITGKLYGSTNLGYYSRAFTLTTYPTTNLAGVITPVLHPILSDYVDDKRKIYSAFVRVSKLLAYAGLVASTFCFLSAEEIVYFMYGDGWTLSAECLKWLSISILPSMMNAAVGGIFQSLGDTKLLFINSCINTVITFSAILLGASFGANVVNLAFFVGSSRMLHMFTAHYMLIKISFGYPLKNFLCEYKGVFAAFMANAILVFVLSVFAPASFNPPLYIVVKFCLIGILTVFSAIIFGDAKTIRPKMLINRC